MDQTRDIVATCACYSCHVQFAIAHVQFTTAHVQFTTAHVQFTTAQMDSKRVPKTSKNETDFIHQLGCCFGTNLKAKCDRFESPEGIKRQRHSPVHANQKSKKTLETPAVFTISEPLSATTIENNTCKSSISNTSRT